MRLLTCLRLPVATALALLAQVTRVSCFCATHVPATALTQASHGPALQQSWKTQAHRLQRQQGLRPSSSCRNSRTHMKISVAPAAEAAHRKIASSPVVTSAAIASSAALASIGGGILAGGLHAVSGPDHLAALLPRIMGRPWHTSMRSVGIYTSAR